MMESVVGVSFQLECKDWYQEFEIFSYDSRSYKYYLFKN